MELRALGMVFFGLFFFLSPALASFSVSAFSDWTRVPVGEHTSFVLSVENSGPGALGPGRLSIAPLVWEDAEVDFNGVDFNVVPAGQKLGLKPVEFKAHRMTSDSRLFFRVTLSYAEKGQLVHQVADVFVQLEDAQVFSARRQKSLRLLEQWSHLGNEISPLENRLDEAAKWDASFGWMVDELGSAYAHRSDCEIGLSLPFPSEALVQSCEIEAVTLARLWNLVQNQFCSQSEDCLSTQSCQNGFCLSLNCPEGQTLVHHVCQSETAIPSVDASENSSEEGVAGSSTGFFSLSLPDFSWPWLLLGGILVLGLLLVLKNRPERPRRPAMNDLRYV